MDPETKRQSGAVADDLSSDAALDTATDAIMDNMLSDADEADEGAKTAQDGTADEATDEDGEGDTQGEADDAEGGGEADGEPESTNEEPHYTVKVDGQEMTVPLKELISGYQRQADYTRKTASVAEEKRAIEAERAKVKDEYNAEVGRLSEFAQIVMATDPVLAEASKINWDELVKTDPIAYTQKSAALQSRLSAIHAIQAEHQRVMTERSQAHLKAELDKAKLVLPELADEAKAKEFKSGMRKYLGDLGFNDQEIDGIADHRVLLAVNEAMGFRKLKAEKEAAAKKKVAGAPTVLKPNVSSDGKAKGKLDAKQKRALRGKSLDAQADFLASLI